MSSAYTPPSRFTNYWSGRKKIVALAMASAAIVGLVVLWEVLPHGAPPPTRTENAGGPGLTFPAYHPTVRPQPRPITQRVQAVPATYAPPAMTTDAILDASTEMKNDDGNTDKVALNEPPQRQGGASEKNDDVPAAFARTDKDYLYEISMGRHIPCNIDGAINSQLRSPIRCVIPEDVRNDDNTIVLLPRGTHVTGELVHGVQFGNDRVAAIWTEIRTSDDPPIKIKLSAPATDSLSRAGIPVVVNDHFWSTLAATAAYSLLEYGPNLATAAIQNGSHASNIYEFNQVLMPQQNYGSQILQKYLNRPPIGEGHQGKSLMIVLNQDIDCARVVHLRLRDVPP